MKLFVGGFSLKITKEDLRKAFGMFGEVASVAIFIRKRYGSESDCFGLVQMLSNVEAVAAIAGLNGQKLNGQLLNVLQRQ
jgi:RNA recognition motif-containing protein